jgi:uncharacterized membrane protein YhaH (DUF805 family)
MVSIQNWSDMANFKLSMLFGFNGRINRTQFFLGGVITSLPCVLMFLFAENFADPVRQIIAGIAFIFLIVLQIFLGCKRLHDTEHGGWYCLLLFVPVANLYLTFLVLSPGSIGPNKYGPEPL